MKTLLVSVVIVAVGVISLGIFLSPDDLKSCQATPSSVSKCHKADAIVAVSGGNTSVRAAEAIRLYKDGWANVLIFSGAALDPDAPSNAEVMKRQAVQAGVPADSIIVEGSSRTTKQNAEQSTTVFSERDITDVILVTSPYHQRRASIEFKDMTQGGVAIRNHPAKDDPDWPTTWWLTPRGWWLAIGEFIKSMVAYTGASS